MDTGPIDLVLDVGNTRTKWALFEGFALLRHGKFANGDIDALRKALGEVPIHAIAMGSVADPDQAFHAALQALAPVLVLDGTSDAPIQNHYGTPDTLGADRLANVVGAARRFPARPVLVIDLGTCITYDLLEGDGTYVGGAISPGLRMRAKAMHAYSARLPEVDPTDDPALLGNTTITALEAGVHHGVLGEIREFVGALSKERSQMAVVLTGGDAIRFARGLEIGIFALPYLTLEGFHALLEHHRTLHRATLAPATGAPDGPRAAG